MCSAQSENKSNLMVRRTLLRSAAFCFALGPASGGLAGKVLAEEGDKKMTGLSNEELAKKVTFDVKDRQFMVTGDLTRSLYDESCTFTDEIDTYTLDKWIDGTSKLFRNDYSKMELDGPVAVTESEVKFRFKEQLMFNIPLLLPKVPLTGELTLKRGSNGLFTRYKEKWDQPVWQVLLSAKLF